MKGPSKETMAYWVEQRKQEGSELLNKKAKSIHTGRLIAALRLVRGLTQQDIADRTGFTQKHISVLEKNPSCFVSTLQKIADGLGVQLIVEFKENEKT